MPNYIEKITRWHQTKYFPVIQKGHRVRQYCFYLQTIINKHCTKIKVSKIYKHNSVEPQKFTNTA